MILRRLLSNIIDFILYLVTFFLIFKVSGLDANRDNFYFLIFISFVVIFILPVLSFSNTIGKRILKLHWEESKGIKTKLLFKYFIYFLILNPSLSIVAAITSLPIFKESTINNDLLFNINIFVASIVSHLLFFFITKGRCHILDYYLKSYLTGYSFKKRLSVSLGIIFLFSGSFFLARIYEYKGNISHSIIDNVFFSRFIKEQYPEDSFYGNRVYTMRKESTDIFTPADPFSFFFKRMNKQKIIFLNLPQDVLKSDSQRRSICYDLILKSSANNLYNDYSPIQTKIVLTSYKLGHFLESYKYTYVYYFEDNIMEWGVYGGIKMDSTSAENYVNFINSHNRSRRKKIEKKFNLMWKEIVNKAEYDNDFKNELIQSYGVSLKPELYKNSIKIYLDTVSLKLNKISFEDVELTGWMGLQFPIRFKTEEHQFYNFLVKGGIPEYDQNVIYLSHLRDLVGKGL